MKHITLRALGTLSVALLAGFAVPQPAHADDGPRVQRAPTTDLFARRKVGRSGAVYCWKPDC